MADADQPQTTETTEPTAPTPTPSPSPETPTSEPQPAEKPARERGPDGKFAPKDKPAEEPPPVEAAPDYSGLKVADSLTPDPAVLDEFKALAGELKLPVDKAQALINLQAKIVDAQVAALNAQHEAWHEQVKRDPQLGGRNYDATQTAVSKWMDKYGGQELRDLLHNQGLGSHPLVIRALAAAGRDVVEDTLGGGRPTPMRDARDLYPNTPGMNP